MKLKTIVFVAAFTSAPFSAFAHDVEKGPNGGQIVDVKGHHVEFTTKDSAIAVYLTDEKDAPIKSAGAEGKAIVQGGGKATTVMLSPTEPNIMTGKLEAPLAPGAKIVVSGRLADGHEILARFVAK